MTVAAALQTPEEIAKASGSSFLVSFAALASDRRRALTAVYAFCRVADDAADDADSTRDGRERLAFWRQELEAAAAGVPHTVVGERLAAAMSTYGVDARHLHAVLDGVAMDLDGVRCDTLDQLLAYCDKVASAVGLACLPVFGASGVHAERYAVALGRALQLTNIARDVRADAAGGRCYVPATWLVEEAVDSSWLAAPADSGQAAAVSRLLARLAAVARGFFAEADVELGKVADRRVLLAPETMAAVYRRLLQRIEAGGAAAVRQGRRARVPAWEKLWLAWQTRRRLR
ncbi:MAG: squalene/phytoene synthase family protein [Planctomycetota bacterium]